MHVDADGREVRRQRADEADDGVLRQGVDRIGRELHQPRERRGGDDRAAAPAHRADGRPDPEHDAVDVDAHDPAVRLVGELGDVVDPDRDTGVEEGDVDGAELVGTARERGVGVGRLADVGLHEDPADLAGDRAAVGVVDVDDSRRARPRPRTGSPSPARSPSRRQ